MSPNNIYLDRFGLPFMGAKAAYPYNVLEPKGLREIEFAPITIFYGGNGSGKSTLLNIIARKICVQMLDLGNDAETLLPFIKACTYTVTAPFNNHCDIPADSRFIRSEEVMHGIIKTRRHNEKVKEHIHNANPELYERFFDNPDGNPGYIWSYDRWIYRALENYSEARSNGELAFDYFQGNITEGTLVLLDEPENSLSPKFQNELAKMISDYARFFKCQFIIATHSPFLLSIKDARIYDLDTVPAQVRPWTELESIKIYADLFKSVFDER